MTGPWNTPPDRGQPPGCVELYQRLVELVEACGPFTYVVTKTTITFKESRLSRRRA